MKIYVVMKQHKCDADHHEEIHSMWSNYDKAYCEVKYAHVDQNNHGYYFWVKEWEVRC